MPKKRVYIKNDRGLEIFTINNFLTESECEYLCSKILEKHKPSEVAGTGKVASTYNEARTSSTSDLPDTDPKIRKIKEKICVELEQSFENGEPMQGQLYEEGQQFKHHQDYFWGDSYYNFCLESGQRTYTFMIYLNDVEEGGGTDFFHLGKTFSPKRKMAVAWKNSNGQGTENEAAMHAGLPVIKGSKMVITQWFREKAYNPYGDQKAAQEYHNKNNN
jgi:prolyl 4-hydroxylase